METKKSPKADLQNKRSIALLIGLVVSMLAVIAIFSWSQTEKVIQEVTFNSSMSDADITPVVVVPDKADPNAPKLIHVGQTLVIVDNNRPIEFDPTFWENLPDIEFNPRPRIEPEQPLGGDDIPVITAEETPTFQGGDINLFRNWCAANIIYPQIAQDNNVQGKVVLSFVVERDGSVSNVQILRGADNELNVEAVRVVSSSPKWNPGKNRGRAVRFTYNMPIDFVLR